MALLHSAHARNARARLSLPDETATSYRWRRCAASAWCWSFYPGDDTSGCTRQLCQFRDEWKEVRARGVEVLGVNPQSAASPPKFRGQVSSAHAPTVDQGQKVASLYHASGLIVKRTVYGIGADGIIRFGQRGMPRPADVRIE